MQRYNSRSTRKGWFAVADDQIKIRVSAEGAAATAEQLAKVTKELEKQDKTQKMLKATSEQLKRQNVIDDLKKQAAEINNVTSMLQRGQAAIGGAATPIASVATNTAKLRAQLGPAAALVGNLGSQFAALVPQTGGVVLSLQRSGMAFGQLLGVLGGGPGILLGGLVAAIGGLATYFADAKKEADELAKATEANAKAMGSYLDQLGKLRSEVSNARQQRQNESDLQRTLDQNKGSVAQYQDELETLRKRLSNDYYATGQSAIDKLGRDEYVKRQAGRVYIQNQIRKREAGLAYAQAQAAALAQQQQEQSSARLDFDAAGTPENPKEGKNPYGPGYLEYHQTMDKIRAAEKENMMKDIREEISAEKAAQKQRYDAWWEQFDAKNKAQKDQWAEDDRIRAEQNEKEARDHEQLMQRLAANRKMYQDLATQSSNIIASTAIKSFQMMAKGQKAEIGAVLEGIGDQIVAMGTGYIFKGIAESILLNPQGPALIGVGTAAVGFGIGLGAAGARAPGGSAGSGANAHGPQNPFSPRDIEQPSALGNQNQGPTVININMPTVVSPTAEDGRRIQEALDAKQRVYG